MLSKIKSEDPSLSGGFNKLLTFKNFWWSGGNRSPRTGTGEWKAFWKCHLAVNWGSHLQGLFQDSGSKWSKCKNLKTHKDSGDTGLRGQREMREVGLM